MDRMIRYRTFDDLDKTNIAEQLDNAAAAADHAERDFSKRRNILKYGDWFAFHDPSTGDDGLYEIHPSYVHAAIIDENKNEVLGWIIKDVNFTKEKIKVPVGYEKSQAVLEGRADGVAIVSAEQIIHWSFDKTGIITGAGDHINDEQRWPFGYSYLEPFIET